MKLGVVFIAFASVWHSVHGQEHDSTFLRGSDVGDDVGAVLVENADIPTAGLDASVHERWLQTLGDWAICSSNSQCRNGCCSGMYSGGVLKCTPLSGGFNSAICTAGPTPTPPPPSPPTGAGSLGDWAICSSNSQCRNGCCSGMYSGGVLKCTPLSGGFNSAICTAGPTPTPPTPTPPSPSPPTGGGSRAYVTYHNYFAGQPLNQVSCSDGRYGLMTRWGYTTIDPMAPYVMATSVSGWNSPNCGKCYRVSGPAGTRYVTAIDQCGPAPGGGMHFDIHPTAYREIMGDSGVFNGSGYVTYSEVSSWNCRGNRG